MDLSRKTLILGATANVERYAYKAAESLKMNNFQFVPVGIREGEIFGEPIITNKEVFNHIDTITLYVGPARQKEWYDYILETNPKRVIFNPGTENIELQLKLTEKGILFEEACTLVLLNLKVF